MIFLGCSLSININPQNKALTLNSGFMSLFLDIHILAIETTAYGFLTDVHTTCLLNVINR